MPDHMFFAHNGFEFATLTALGFAPYGLAEVGEVVATAKRVTDGDPDSWFDEWMATGEGCRTAAEQCEAAGHPVSARWLYLRAAHYMSAVFFYVLATNDPS